MTDEEIFMLAQKVKLLILDVDGVLTDGGVIYGGAGHELKKFNVRDGHGIKLLQRSGVKIAFITGRESQVVARRAEELKVDYIFQKAIDKLKVYDELKAAVGLADDEFCSVGDDLLDIPIAIRVGFPVAVADADDELKKRVKYVTKANGGFGAVREICEIILKSKGLWEGIMERYDR